MELHRKRYTFIIPRNQWAVMYLSLLEYIVIRNILLYRIALDFYTSHSIYRLKKMHFYLRNILALIHQLLFYRLQLHLHTWGVE